jgi:ribosomal protein L21E
MWLQKAYEKREASMVWVKIDPGFDDLRSDPRFQGLLRRMRLSD